MITLDWQEEIKTQLEQIPNSEVFFSYPEHWPKKPIAVITYAGLNNVPGEIANDEEYTTAITVKLDVWHRDPDTVNEISKDVIRRMYGIGYERQFVCDFFERESGLHHKSMRFKGEF